MSDLPTYEDVLRMLSDKARDGSVSAMIALERASRDDGGDNGPLDDALEALLRGK